MNEGLRFLLQKCLFSSEFSLTLVAERMWEMEKAESLCLGMFGEKDRKKYLHLRKSYSICPITFWFFIMKLKNDIIFPKLVSFFLLKFLIFNFIEWFKLCYRGVGKWILKLLQGFFETGSGSSEPEDLAGKGSFWLMLGISQFLFYFIDVLGKVNWYSYSILI